MEKEIIRKPRNQEEFLDYETLPVFLSWVPGFQIHLSTINY
jgi:hypothetical protein